MWIRNLAQYSRTNLLLWMTLSFQAGFINAGGLLACHRFVTHTTGFATLFGVEFARGHWIDAVGMFTTPLFFLLGAMLSAFFVDRRISNGRSPRYTLLIGVISILLFSISLAGNGNAFGIFGGETNIRTDYFLLALLCLTSGIQNAAITSASGAIVRTTHLTGLTTDLGIGLIRVLHRSDSEANHQAEIRGTGIRLGLIGGFVLGSTAGAFAFLNFQYLGFLIPAAISGLLCLGGIRLQLWSNSFRNQEGRTSA